MSEHWVGNAPKSGRDVLRDALIELVQAPDSEARRRLLDASPELLGDEAAQVLGELAGTRLLMSDENRRGLDEVIAVLEEYRDCGGQVAEDEPSSSDAGRPAPETPAEAEGSGDTRRTLAGLLARVRRENPETADEFRRAMATLLGASVNGSRSLAETAEVSCDGCQHEFETETWVIVDAEERPDLATKCREGTIHDVECPSCGRACSPDAPLLYHNGQAEQLILAVQDSTTVDEDREVNQRLLGELYPHLADYWDMDYLENTRVVPGVEGLQMLLQGHDPRQMLGELLERVLEGADSPEAAQERMSQLAETLGGSMPDEALLETVWSFVQADSWLASKRVVDEHPELLTEEADNALASMIAIGQLLDESASESLTEHRDLLRRCREAGVNRAFAQKMGMEPAEFGRLADAVAGMSPEVIESVREMARSADTSDEAMGAFLEHDEVRRTLANALFASDVESGPQGLISRGNFMEGQGLWDEAADSYAEALSVYEKTGDERGQVTALSNLGDVFSSRGQYDMAISLYQRAIRTAETLGDSLAIAEVRASIAYLYLRRGDYDKADELFRAAATVIEVEGDERDVAVLYNNMAALYQYRGDYRRAESLYQQVISIYAGLNDPDRSAAAYANLGALYANQNQDDKALDMFQKGMEIERRLGHEAEAAGIYNNIAVIYERMRDYPRALAMYEKSQEICDRLGADPQLAGIYLNMGGLRAKSGDQSQAIVDLQRSLEIAERIGEKGTIAMACFNLGLVYQLRQDKAQAVRYFRRARELFVQIGNKQQEALSTVKIMLLGESD